MHKHLTLPGQNKTVLVQCCTSIKENWHKVISHAGVDSRMIILDDQARQQMTLHFQLSLQCIEVTIGSEESFVHLYKY